MIFDEQLWFWALVLLPLLVLIFVGNERRREKLVRKLVAARLQDRLAGNVSIGRRRLRFTLLLLALACLIVALARPQYGFTWEESKRKGRDVIIAIDCSRSMLATDLAPNRLGRAKLAAQDFIGQLTGDRVGLIAFAGSAFLQAPLTVDYGAVMTSLNELDTSIIPRGGTNIAAAIKEAEEAFGKGEGESRCLVIFTDGEELDADGVNAAAAQKDKIKIFTVGLGSTDGSLIPIPGQSGGTEFVKDAQGQIVKSRLDEDRLRKIAEATGGFYLHLQSGPAEMQKIVREGLGQMKEQEIDARMSRRPIERYQWPLAAGLAFLFASTLLSERKRAVRGKSASLKLAVLALLMWLPFAAQAKNGGVEAYEREDYKGAMDEFGRQLQRQRNSEALQFNLGAAAYKSGDFAKALDAFAKAVTSPDPNLHAAAEYNIGNTLFQQGAAVVEKDKKVLVWKDALQHYEQALKVEPQHPNAEHNRDIVRKLLAELEKEPPQQDQQQQKDQKKDDPKKDEKKKENQDQQQQQSQDKPQDKQDKQDQQNQSKDQQQSQKDQSQEKSEQSQKSTGDEQKDQSKQGESKPDQSKPESSKEPQDQSKQPQDKKDGPEDPSEPKDGNGPKDQKKQDQPAPSPDQAEKKREGEIKAQGDQPPPTDAQQEAAAEAQAAAEGKMTEAQAMNLLESLKGEDDRVQLLKPNERRPSRLFRDW